MATATKSSVIRSMEEVDEDSGQWLFWSNDDGWVDRDSATVFESREGLNLPTGGEWVDADNPFEHYLHRCWREGKVAALRGEEDCPHVPGTKQHDWWWQGWDAGVM